MTGTRYSECFCLVPDVEVTREFYESALRLEPNAETDHSVSYGVEGTTLKFQADYPPEIFESFNLDPPENTSRGEGVFIVLSLSDPLEEVYQRVKNSAGSALFAPRCVDWLDGKMFLAKDPYGYTLELR